MSKRTYINLINDFWDKYAQEPISTPAAMVYLYLLNRINRNRWEPIFISNSELAKGANIGRRSLPAYKVEIAGAGLLTIEDQGEGRTAGTVYGLPAEEPETAQKVTVKLRKNAHKNRAKMRNSDKETAQKRAINRAKMRSLEPATPINDIYKDNIRPSTSAEDMRAGAREAVAVVEVEAVEISDKNKVEIAGAAERLELEKERAAAQGQEVLKAFFTPYNSMTLKVQLMQNQLDATTYRKLAEEVIADWTEAGECHDDWRGNFDIKAAIKHLQNTIRKKAEAYRRNQAAPKSRQQARQELMDASLRNLNAALSGQYAQTPETPEPF